MPELPEVEALTRTLRPLVRGQKILCVHVFHAVVIQPQTIFQFKQRARGPHIEDVFRHGKYLFLGLDRGQIEIHFRFDGKLLWFSSPRQLMQCANRKKDGTHVDVAFELDSGVRVAALILSVRPNPKSSTKRLCPFSAVL